VSEYREIKKLMEHFHEKQ
jgi:hypothetical protein